MMQKVSIDHLVTHGGSFHADEVLAAGILETVFPEAVLVRSRDKRIYSLDPTALYFDIGGEYDPARLRFDHHQADAPEREDGTPYSSFGLIWKHFGRAWLELSGVASAEIEAVHERMDRSIVLPIDRFDTGAVSPSVLGEYAEISLPALISAFNPTHEEPGAVYEQAAFDQAKGLANTLLTASAHRMSAECRASGMVLREIRRSSGPVLELPKAFPFDQPIADAGEEAAHILFVIQPRGPDWLLYGVARVPGAFERRMDLPEEWAGLTGDDLARVTGVEDAVFCHRGRFIAVAGSREGILRLAGLALAEPRPEQGAPTP